MTREHLDSGAWFVAVACLLCACESVPSLGPAAPPGLDGGVCADRDGDGFGDGCARGRDCDDGNAAVTHECLRCLEPDLGCSCAQGAEPVACFLDPSDLGGGQLMCHEGTRHCRNGAWGACESVHSYVMDRRAATRLVPDAGHPNCTPCDVLCYRVDDNLDPVDGGLTDANSGGVQWAPGGGLTLQSYLADAGGSGIDAAVDNDAAVPVCQLGVPPDADCDGIPDTVDPFPGSPPFVTQYDAIYHALAPGQTGTSSLDLTFNLNNADVYFLLDQSGSMDGERANLIADLRTGTFLDPSVDCADTDFDGLPNNELKSQGIIGSTRCLIRDAWFGAGYFVEYPLGSHGHSYANGNSDDETVYRHLQSISQDISLVDDALESMFTNGNIDTPESDVPALWSVATGQGMYLGHDRQGVPPQTSCPAGTHGYPCFRDTAIPIVVLFTDASFHNGPPPTPNAYASSYAIASGTQTSITPVPSTNEAFVSAFDVGDVTNSLVTLAGTTANAAADIPGSLMGCGAANSARDVVFKFDVSQQRAITIKTDGTVQDTLISLFSGLPRTDPTTTTAITGESHSLGDIYDQWIELTGTTVGNVGDYQGGVIGCNAGAAGKDTVVSFTPSQDMALAVESSLLDRVAWFRMGDGDTYPTVVDVTGGHDGLMTNMASGDLVADAPPAGSFANTTSLDFDGSDDVIAVADDAELDITDALTVSVWVKGGSQDNTVISKYNTSSRRSWRIAASGTRARVNVSNTGGPYDSSNMKEWNTSFTPFDGAWHHIAFTYQAGTPDGTLKVFVDGVEDTAITRTWDPNVPSLYSTTANVVIGGYYSENDPFVGRIDEVAIWNAVLTPSEVARVYNGGSPADLNALGGTIVGLYTALPPSKPAVTAVANTNDTVATARNATNNLVGAYLSFSGDTDAPGITPALDGASVGCGAATTSNDAVYRFTLAQDRRVRIDTEGSAFDTVISLHDVAPATVEPGTGTNTNEVVASAQLIGALVGQRYLYAGDTSGMAPDYDGSFVGCGAASGANDAVYSFTLASPRTVRINASSTTAFDPAFSLHGAIPTPSATASTNANDALSTAQAIGVVDGLRRVYTGGDTSSLAADYTAAAVGCGATDAARDAVVDFTLSSAATVEIDTQGSAFDTVIGLFDDVAAADSLVSWWRMGDGDTYSTITDVVGGANGTMNSMAVNDFELVVPTQDHPNAYSTNFDGSDDYVAVADAAALDFSTEMTFSAWVKGAAQSATIAAKYQTSSSQRSWRVYGISGSGGIGVGVSSDGTWSSTTTKDYVTSGVTALDNTWHHVAFTFSANDLRIYIDGVQAAVTATYDATVNSIYQGTSELTIGAHLNGGSSSRYAGNIDEVTVWSASLSATQVGQLYNSGAPSNPTQLGTFPSTRPAAVSVAAPSTGIDFDGSDDSAVVATDAGLNITNNMTVSMWANVATGTKTLASRYRTSGNHRAWRLSSDGAKLRVIVSNNGNYGGTTAKDYTTTADVFGAGWVHVGFTFASNVLTLYVNGVAQAVTQTHNATVNTLYSSTTPATIVGGYENTGSGGITEEPDGVIDEVSIWNVARSGAQMTAMYNAGVPTDLTGSTGLVAWWRMGEGSTYPTLNDAVGTRHMSMANMASDDFVAGVPGNVFYANEAKATAYDVGTVNGRWKVFSGNTAAMTSDGPTFACGSNASAPDAYFQFTLTSPASVIVDSIGSAFDTSIGVFPEATTTFNAASLTICDDDSGGSSTSSLTTGTLAAGTYYVVVKGAGAATGGAYELSVRDAAGAGVASNTLGTRIACNDDDGTENTSRIVASLPAGTYHVVVKSTGGSGAYTLRVSDQSASSGAIACANPAGASSGTAPDGNCTYRTYGTHGYWFCSDNRSWNTARANCQAIGYELISIDDAGEQSWANTYRSGETHIGYTDSATEGTFVWSNGSASTHTAWGSGQPNNSGGGQDCTEFYYSDGTWNDNDCTSESQDYICESAPLYDSEIVESLAAGTYYVVLKGTTAADEGAYSVLIEDAGASGAPFMCNDDGAVDGSSAIEADLVAGTYHVVVKGKSAAAKGAYQLTLRDATGVPSNSLGCGNDSVTTSLTAGQTYYAVVKGDAVAGDGPFGLTFQDVGNSGGQLLACDDNSGPGSQSLLTRTLDPGTYYLAMKKANHSMGQGNYQISFGGAASTAGTFAPPTWNETIAALNAADVRVMSVYSTGGSDTTLLQSHVTALANATDAIGQSGSPLVSSMAGDGTGLSSALVNQIQELAQYLSMDVQLRVSFNPDTPPAPGFLFNFVPVDESPGNGCSGVAGIEHQGCLPGATPRFNVSITNPLGTPVPPNTAPGSNGGYNFRLQLVANDRYVVDEIPVFILPLEEMVVPPATVYEPEGTYWQDVASTSCAGSERPSWRDLLFNVTVPDGTDVEFDACGGDSQAELDACTLAPVITVTGSGACTMDSDCGMGSTCASNGVCQLITAGACTTDANCSSTSSCINNLCTYAASPANLLHAIGPSNNYRNLLRLKITLHSSMDRMASPQLDQWQIRYECAQIQ